MTSNNPMTSELRQHLRTAFATRVKMMHSNFGEFTAKTRDLSQGGVFLITNGEVKLPIGEHVNLQTLDMPCEAPIVKAEVVRTEADGLALMFCED